MDAAMALTADLVEILAAADLRRQLLKEAQALLHVYDQAIRHDTGESLRVAELLLEVATDLVSLEASRCVKEEMRAD